jgi:magnesium transporter
VAGFVIEFFKGQLDKFVELIFFMPLLMGSGGNAGTQASTVVIRAIATGEITPALFPRVLWKEVRVGLLVGLCMGLLSAGRAFFLPASSTPHLQIALTVGGTMFFVVTIAKCTGAMLPLLFKKFNLDPALMSNPMIQSIMDIVTLTSYFMLARFFLPF